MAVSEYAKARGKSSKSSVNSNATINTTSNLSSTNAFRLTAIGLGLGLLAAGFSIPASANNGTSNHHDGTYSHSHGSHGTHTHTNGNNSHNNPNGPGNSGSSISLNFEGDNPKTITRTNGQTLNILGGASGNLTTNNIGVFGSGDSLHIQLAENLTGLTSVTTGNSLLNTSGLAITGGPTFTKARVDVAGNKITGVASGVGNDSNAANIGDLNNAVAANKTKYYSVKNTSAAAATGPGSNVNNDGATKPNAMAMGVNASATGGQAIAIGSGDSGQNTTASGEQSIAIGANVESSGNSSIAIGGDDLDDASKVGGVNALFDTYTGGTGGLVTVGDYSGHTKSDGAASVAIGVKAHSKGNLSTAVGVRSSSSGDASSAFGVASSAREKGSVAIGAGSVADRAGAGGGIAAYTGGATGDAITAINSTIGRAELGAVSVGPGGEKGTRQIINVAAGSADSDAVNVAQLKGVDGKVNKGLNFGGDSGNTFNRQLGDKISIKGTQTVAGVESTRNMIIESNGVNTLLVKLKKDIDLGNAGSVKTGNSLLNNAGFIINNTDSTQVVSLTSAGLNNGGKQIKNVGSAGSLTDINNANNAVNVSDLNSFGSGLDKVDVAAGTNVNNVTPSTVGNLTTYTVNADGASVSSANSGAITVNGTTDNATNITDYKIDLGADTKASLVSADNALQSVVTQIDGTAVKTITKTNNTANFITGDNILLTPESGGIKVALAKDLTDLNSATFDGVSISKNGINNGGNQITGVASGIGNDSNAANIGDLNTAVAANKTKYYSVKSDAVGNADNLGATGANAMAMGGNAKAEGGQAIAIGSVGSTGKHTIAKGQQSIAIGANVQSLGASSIAIGGDDLDAASQTNIDSDILSDLNAGTVNASFKAYSGNKNLVETNKYDINTESAGAASIAIGSKSLSGGDLSTAVGVHSSSSGTASSAFGVASSAREKGSVAIGAGSVADRAGAGGGIAAYTGGATGDAITAINSTIGRAELGAVSVGPGGEKGTRQIINVAAGSADSDAVNVAQLKGGVSSVVNLGFDITADNASLAPGETKDKVKLGETVKYTSADGSIATTVADNEINFALGDNLSVGGSGQDGEDGVDGFIGVNGADGQSGIALNGANGTIGLTGPTGASGTIGIIDGVPGVNGVDGITRIVIDDIQVATMKDGMKFEGNTGDTIAKKLNQTLNIEGTLADSADASGANLRVDSDGSKLNLVMAKNLTDLDSIMINNGGPIISRTGIDMGPVDANSYPINRITNLGKGIAGTDAVNRDQLDELTTDLTDLGLNFGGDSGDPVNLKLGQKLMVKGGDTINADPATKNISVTANGEDTLTVRLAKDINLGETGSVTTGNTQVNNAGITLYRGGNGQVALTNNGLNNGNNKITNVAEGTTGKDAVNFDQLSLTNTNVSTNAAGIKTNKDAIALGIKIGDGNSANDQQFALGSIINVTGDSNITTTASATGVQVKLNNQLNLGDDGRMQMGTSLMNNTGFTFVGNEPGRTVILGAGGLNNGFNRITNVAAGLAPTDAATVGQLSAATFALDKGWALSTQGDEATMVKQGSAFDLNSRDGNIKISRTAAASSVGRVSRAVDPNDMTFDLNRDIAIDSVQTGDTTINNQGLTIVGGPSVTKAGINAADTKVTNVVNGEVAANSKDAINGGQLYAQGAGISSIIGGNTTYDPATGTFTNSNIGGTGQASIDGAIASIKRGEAVMTESIQTNTTNITTNTSNITKNTANITTNTANISTNTTNIKANKDKIDAGLNFGADSGAVINKPIGDGSVMSFKGGNNIKTTAEGNSIKFDLNGNINVESVTTGNTTVNNSGMTIKNGPSMTAAGIYAGNTETAPSMTAAGISAAGTKVTNVADGMAPRDAVNYGQLEAVTRGLGGSINELGYKIGEVEDDANAGISAAMAMSSLPQAYIIGKPMIGGGIATFNGESAVAIGFSKMSNDGRWVMKLNGTADTQGNVGGAIGAGFHFD